MAKQWNKLYPDPKKARAHDVGAEIVITQPVKAVGKKFSVYAHSTSALYFNMALKAERKATEQLKEIYRRIHQGEDDLVLLEDEKFVPFLNEVLNLIVWGYAAIEAMANNRIESKGDGSLYDTLRDKIQVTLPRICSKPQLPKKLWNKFKWIEEVRDKIIHPRKTDYYDAEKWENPIYYDFLNGKFNGVSKAVKDILEHFKNKIPTGTTTFHNVQRGMGAKPPG